MKTTMIVLGVLLAAGGTDTVNFDTAGVGKAPGGWTATQTGTAGKEDQAGGLVWRAKDANNYYIARANAPENNVTVYHTINGRRSEKKRANFKVPSNLWHMIRVDFQANHFVVTFNGQKALQWDDETFK